jgi:hypothetical protein
MEATTRMTARIREIEPGVIEADYTLEPPRMADAEVEYTKRFKDRVAARAWLESMAVAHAVVPVDVMWIED